MHIFPKNTQDNAEKQDYIRLYSEHLQAHHLGKFALSG